MQQQNIIESNNDDKKLMMNEKTKFICHQITKVYDHLKQLSSKSSAKGSAKGSTKGLSSKGSIKGLSSKDSSKAKERKKSCSNNSNHNDDDNLINLMYKKILYQNGGYKINGKNNFIAKGGFGSVYRIERNGQRYACKIITDLNSLKKTRSRFYNEIQIMKLVNDHPNIIKLYDYFEIDFNDQDKEGDSGDLINNKRRKLFFIIMEYSNSQSLSKYLKRYHKLNEKIVQEIFGDLVDAIKFLHNQNIVHRDIKLSNILLHRSRSLNNHRFHYQIKLCDFGLSSIDNGEKFLKPAGTSLYMAPEILCSYYFYQQHQQIKKIHSYCGYKGDVWALGVCMYFTLHGYYPLDLINNNNNNNVNNTKQERLNELKKIFEPSSSLSLNIQKDDQRYTNYYLKKIEKKLRNFNYKLSVNCRDCLSRMLSIQSTKRATIQQIDQHLFFNTNRLNKNF